MSLAPTPWTQRPYQSAALDAIGEAWRERDRTCVVMATGTGKTSLFVDVLRARHEAGHGRALVLAHRLELLTQARDRFTIGGLGAHIESGDALAPLHQCSTMEPAHVVVATVQSLRGRRLERWAPDAFDTIVVDECHHATSAGYRAILDRFPAAKILGVTATPDRGDGVALGGAIDHCAYEYDLRDGIRDGYLSPLTVLYPRDTIELDLSTVRTTRQEHGRDFAPSDLAAQLESRGDKGLHELAAPIARESGSRPTLVFVPSVHVAHGLARVLAGYVGADQVCALDGASDPALRRETLARYQRGELRILCNCALFTEGFDAPSTACVAIARPTKSRSLYAQMIGRGTRVHGAWTDEPATAEERRAAIAAGSKPDCMILDLSPSNARHSLVSPVDLLAGDDIPDDVRAEVRAAANREDVLAALDKALTRSQARDAEHAKQREQASIVAQARYQMLRRDPFAELGIDGAIGSERGPRATQAMIDAITRAGLVIEREPSVREARKLLDSLADRRRRGLCTIKQARALAAKGLRRDLSFADARSALDALAANRWRVTPAMAERWGET